MVHNIEVLHGIYSTRHELVGDAFDIVSFDPVCLFVILSLYSHLSYFEVSHPSPHSPPLMLQDRYRLPDCLPSALSICHEQSRRWMLRSTCCKLNYPCIPLVRHIVASSNMLKVYRWRTLRARRTISSRGSTDPQELGWGCDQARSYILGHFYVDVIVYNASVPSPKLGLNNRTTSVSFCFLILPME